MAFVWNQQAQQQAQSEDKFAEAPEGIYQVVVNEIEDKTTSKGGKALVFEVEIVNNRFAGRKSKFNYVNYADASGAPNSIGQRDINNIVLCGLGIDSLDKVSANFTIQSLVGKLLTVKLVNEEFNGYKNLKVKKWEKSNKTAVTPKTTSPSTKPSEAQDADVPF
jgi:hypothetical protein